MCYYYNYLFLILSCKGTHSFRTINKLRLIFRTPHAKTLQRYAFVLVPQDPSFIHLQIINNYFSTNSDKPGQPALFHEKIRQASDRESMPAGFTLDGYRNENERLSEEGIDPACRLFETFLQFLVRQFRDNGLSIGGKVRLLARKREASKLSISSPDRILPGRMAAALAKESASESQISSCTSQPVSIARSTIFRIKDTGSRFSTPAGRPLTA